MFSLCKYVFLCIIPVIKYPQLCSSEPVFPPMLVLYSPGDPEYTDVLVRREHDNLTLVCELRGDPTPRSYVWNYVNNGTIGQSGYSVEPAGAAASSTLSKHDLQVSDSGQYMCSAPPHSVSKYILVQTKGPMRCARGAFRCGARCVLAVYVCDGRADCAAREDEAPQLCQPDVCARGDKLNCSSGRCVSAAACCRGAAPLCRQPACCDEFRAPGLADEYPPLFEDRRAPDDYGFIQSTIYTVTACALIFMIAVVLLVSAICKMHMKRAALRNYTHADRHHYTVQYAQAHRFPPCYEASRLLEENRTASPQLSPGHVAPTPPEVQCCPAAGAPESPEEAPRGRGLLSAMFSSRYSQVPTQPSPVELQSVRGAAPGPPRAYRSPACCAPEPDFQFRDDAAPALARDLNYGAAPLECLRRRTMRRNTLERVMDQLDRQRLTLQLGRFQLSIPRFGRPDPRPDTPNVAEINIDDLDFVRLNSNDTYTLNGRTIRLLGADFENYPVMPDGSVRPPSYTEAVRYKLYGPPPEYLSRDGLNRRSADTVDQEATSNIEMPPCYDDLNAINQFNGNDDNGNVSTDNNVVNGNNVVDNGNDDAISEENRLNAATNAVIETVNVNLINSNVDSTQNGESHETFSSIIDNLPAIDSDVNANEPDVIVNDNVTNNIVSNPAVINSVNNNIASPPVNRSVTNAVTNNVIASNER